MKTSWKRDREAGLNGAFLGRGEDLGKVHFTPMAIDSGMRTFPRVWTVYGSLLGTHITVMA